MKSNTLNTDQHQFSGNTYVVTLCLILIMGSTVFFGCAGPLDTATRKTLDATYTENIYLAKVYLGSQYYLVYTNNSVEGRSPTGVFVDRSLTPWYETDASFWDSGTSGDRFTLDELRDIDQDLDFDTFGQGITAGQVVAIKKIDDKSDQLVFEVETLRRHDVTKSYGAGVSLRSAPRASRIHVLLGKEGMKALDQTLVQEMLDQVLMPAPILTTVAEKEEFIRSHYPQTPIDDLLQLTKLPKRKIQEIAYAHALTQGKLPPTLQTQLAESVAANQDAWVKDFGMYLRAVSVEGSALQLDFATEEVSDYTVYATPELRAAYIFFDRLMFLIESLKPVLKTLSDDVLRSSFQQLVVSGDYLYIDGKGRQFPETIVYTLNTADLRQFAADAITEQELAARAELVLGTTPGQINVSAFEAAEKNAKGAAATWKNVKVIIAEYDYEIEKDKDKDKDKEKDEEFVTIRGTVENIGTWIAENVLVAAVLYDKYGSALREEVVQVAAFLKPGQTQSFSIRMDGKGMRRPKLFLDWKEVK